MWQRQFIVDPLESNGSMLLSCSQSLKGPRNPAQLKGRNA